MCVCVCVCVVCAGACVCVGYAESSDLQAFRSALREANGDEEPSTIVSFAPPPAPILVPVPSFLSLPVSVAIAAPQPPADPLSISSSSSLSLPLSLPLSVPLYIPSSNPPSPSPSFSPSPSIALPPLLPSLLSPTPFSPHPNRALLDKKNKLIDEKKKILREKEIFKKLLKKEKMIISAMNFPKSWKIEYAIDERELFTLFVGLIKQHDPDIMIGYEVQKDSIGYLLKRGDVMGKDIIVLYLILIIIICIHLSVLNFTLCL